MTDQPRLRDALQRAVPDAPVEPDRGAAVRGIAARRRRTRQAWVGALAAVVALGGAGVWATHRHDSGMAVAGTGDAACHALAHRLGGGTAVDSRVVDGSTAARWLGQVAGGVDASRYTDQRRVTVCVIGRPPTWSTYAVGGGRAERVTAGQYSRGPHNLVSVMAELDNLSSGGAFTTNVPFRCPGELSTPAQDVSSSLPSGATGALLCYRDDTLYSPRRILDSPGVDALVLAIDRAPVTYVAPHVTCGGVPDFRDYSIVFRYPTGTRTVSMEECRGLALGPFTREAPTNLDLRFERLALADGGIDTGSPTCPVPDDDPPRGTGDLRHVVAASYCPPGGVPHPLSADRLRRLQRWGTSLEPGTTQIDGPCAPPASGWPHVAVTDAWGNHFTMTIECRGRLYPVVRAPGGSGHLTYPIGDQQIIERLLRELAPFLAHG